MHTTTMRRLMASAALATGLAVGFAAAADAQPNNSTMSDYWECVADHPDKVGAETCCIFYGGTWDPSQYMYECSLDRGEPPKSTLDTVSVDPGTSAPPKGPRVTPGRLAELVR
ncbi:hypothetical protein A5724_08620 [Mycobacterium sp. ACS1612]|uniref:hypothetical protein n=1 Tax=Mycobacterium sp. ACS1612 TaxID=1834117 RepID=UPI0007FCCE64|nr:hypothetical protein [Mycobacterium sp. ACS1612]OBF39455.1 hypothetical protein A5724_08620 [Mycobacterium sp. ACS1612]